MNKLANEDRAKVIAALVEGCSIRSTVRLTGVSKKAVLKLVEDIGEVCLDLHNDMVIDIKCQRVQADEIWSFVGCKDKNVPEDQKDVFGVGDVWTWIAIDADTKLCVSYMPGQRDSRSAWRFINNLKTRLSNRVQLTTDGYKCYLEAVEGHFGEEIDYAQVVKVYGQVNGEDALTITKTPIIGAPDDRHVSTSFVERQNLTMRMSMRRFTRKTNAFSKKLANHVYAIALHFAHYNFCRIHQSLKMTPAMASGLTDSPWSINDLVLLLENKELEAIRDGAMKRGEYGKKSA